VITRSHSGRTLALLLFLFAWWLFLMWATPASAHDQYHEWKIPGTMTSCCNDNDCRPTRARVTEDGFWEAWDGKEWLTVPQSRVLPFTAPDGRSHLCAIGGVVLCFTPGEIRG